MAPYIESATLCDQGHIEYAQPEKDSPGQPLVDMRFEMAKLITGEAIPPGHCAALRIYRSIELKDTIIVRATDLTDEEIRKQRSEVDAAVYEKVKSKDLKTMIKINRERLARVESMS